MAYLGDVNEDLQPWPLHRIGPIAQLHDGTTMPTKVGYRLARKPPSRPGSSFPPFAVVELEVVDGRVEVVRFALEAQEDGRAVTSVDYRWWDLDGCVNFILAHERRQAAIISRALSGYSGVDEIIEAAEEAGDSGAKWGYRRQVDDELLAEVAAVVEAHPRNPRPIIEKRFNTSLRNASRWIKAARDAGFLPKEEVD